ncbi:MAG: capsule assembly Wzi family protein [Terracidiphilus sp.]
MARRGLALPRAVAVAALILVSVSLLTAQPQNPGQKPRDLGGAAPACLPDDLDSPDIQGQSPYIPVDSWVYPAVFRLYSLGFVDNVFLGMRPWKRSTVAAILEEAASRIEDADTDANASSGNDEAQGIYEALKHELRNTIGDPCLVHKPASAVDSIYTVARAISGTPLRDSFHLGSSIVNDYGRPYANGFNNYTGASAHASAGRFLIYARGELQATPSATGYSTALAQQLAYLDETAGTGPFCGSGTCSIPYTNQSTIPLGPIGNITNGRFLEAYISANLIGHEISFGKLDNWLGPGLGAGMAYSNNAENIYALRINRVEGFHIPLLSSLLGPFRWDFMVGELRGHTFIPNPAFVAKPSPSIPNVITPGNPWVHVEKISFRPSENLEMGFSRTAIWGGKGHGPITLHTFLKSFFSLSSPLCKGGVCPKFGRDDPGARFGTFDFSYRLPFVRNWLTLYSEGEVHDDISPIDAPRRAAWRPGIYLSHVPGLARLDLRAEGVYTDPAKRTSNGGVFMYWETIQRQGYTNQGQLFGDWIGREGKGGQAWLTYHFSGNEWFQVGVRNQKVAKDFIADLTQTHKIEYGTTLNDINFQVVKRLGRDFELNGSFAFEHYKAPIYLPGQQTVTTTNIQLTWYPERKVSF